jgi:hypothetical protein
MWRGLLVGLVAGAAGTAVMTAGEKAEQAVTGRKNSSMPSRTLSALLGKPTDRLSQTTGRNWLMHYGTGIVAGGLRGVMAERGLRGPGASLLHTVLRLTIDQSLENGLGVGSPPWTWPRRELAMDVGHKAVYAFATGAVADALVTRR